MHLLRRVAARLISFQILVFYILEIDKATLCASALPVVYRLGTESDLDRIDMAQFDYDPSAIAYSKRRLAAGDIFIVGELDAMIVSYCWLCLGQFQADMDYFLPLKEDMVTVYKVFTHECYRGKNIYPSAYTFIAPLMQKYGIKICATSINDLNWSSRRSVDKIGYQKHGCYCSWRFGGQKYFRLDMLIALLRNKFTATFLHRAQVNA